MSDTTVAPDSAPAAAPTPNEVPIETNPVQLPNPIGSQAPERQGAAEGPASPHRPQSRREAIQAAFERANQPQRPTPKQAPRPAPKPAEAKPGHNQPPEATPKEQPARFDLKKRPADQEAQPRGERGQFAPRPKSATENRSAILGEAESGQTASQPGQPVRELPANAPFREPLPRMSDRARAEWHAVPEAVRGDLHRIAQEFGKAYQFYKDDHVAMQPIRRFHQLAQQHGTTLERALVNYTSMEHKLRTDPIAGLDTIVNNLNLKTSDGQKLTLRDVAYHVLSRTPEQLQVMQQGNNQIAAANQIGALHQEVAGLKQTLQQMHTQVQFTHTRAGVDQFAETHPRFDELGDLIEQELKLGFDLETAYRRADMLRPSTHAAQTRTTSAQTRPTTDRSISGAPGRGYANGNGLAHSGRTPGRREAIENAIRKTAGGL